MGFNRVEAAQMRQATQELRRRERIDQMRSQVEAFQKQVVAVMGRRASREDSSSEEDAHLTDPSGGYNPPDVPGYFYDQVQGKIVVDEEVRGSDEEERKPSIVQTDLQRQYFQALEDHYKPTINQDPLQEEPEEEDDDAYDNWR